MAVTSLLASAILTGCSPDGEVIDSEYAKVCQDQTTQERVEDSKCSEEGRHSGHAGWYFLPLVGRIPAIGQRLSGGTTTAPRTGTTRTGVNPRGETFRRDSTVHRDSTVRRGGFGSSTRHGSFGG